MSPYPTWLVDSSNRNASRSNSVALLKTELFLDPRAVCLDGLEAQPEGFGNLRRAAALDPASEILPARGR